MADAPRGTEDGLIDAARRDAVRAAPAETAASSGSGVIGQSIGPYKLLSILGEGGMGTVYLAEQAQPVRRRVALKIIKLGMDTRSVIARFEAERQALAMMDHPNVAKVFDAGTTEAGRPYFVMEHVPGIPITEHCDRHRLSTPERLELFDQVCQAVQHAHTKGVIHRDIKPSNVLVSTQEGRPHARAIDFGVAKATAAPLTEKTLFTEQGQLIGTPAYMSPEQAEMTAQDIDTRSDIYSLGVLLYELLTGATPFDAHTLLTAGYAEMLRIIREVEPPKPSTRLSGLKGDASPAHGRDSDSAHDIATRRRSDPRTLVRAIRGDLDWIVMKCLEKDRTRRYETANGLAMEIRRYLNNEPVLAGPPSAGYRARKFIRRNRGAVFAATLVLTALVLGIIGTSIGFARAVAAHAAESEQRRHAQQEAARADEQRRQAEKERDKASTVADFMASVFQGVGPTVALGRDTTILKELLDGGAKRITDGELKKNPEAEIQLRLSLARTYREIAAYDAADRMLRPALELARKSFDKEHPLVADTLSERAWLLKEQGRGAEALPDFEASLEMRKRLFKGDHPEVVTSLNDLALCLDSVGRSAEALPEYDAALEMSRRLFNGDHIDVATSLGNVAFCLDALGRSADALPKHEEALAMRQRLSKGDHPEVAQGLNNVADCLRSLGRSQEALPKFEAALEMQQRLFSGDHPRVARGLNNVAACLYGLGRFPEALPKFKAAVEMRRRLFKGDHPDVATGLQNVANCLQSMGRSAEALPKLEEALEMQQRLFKGDSPDVARSVLNVAICLKALGRSNEALRKFEVALEMNQRLFKGDHPNVAKSMSSLGLCLDSVGRSAEALPKLEAALAMQNRLFKGGHPDVAVSLNNMGGCLQSLGRSNEALPKFEAAQEMFQRLFKGDNPGVARCTNNVGGCLQSLGRSEEALPKLEAALEMRQRLFKGDHPDLADSLNGVAICLQSLGRLAEARPKLEAALEMRRKVLPANHQDIRVTEIRLGSVLVNLRRYNEAERMLVTAQAALADRPDVGAKTKKLALETLVNLYAGRNVAEPGKGYDAKAAEWRTTLTAWQATTQPATTQSTVPATQPVTSRPADSPNPTSSSPATKD